MKPALTAFVTVSLAELPDKTMVASLVLTTRYRRPFAVWVGVAGAFAIHVVVAATLGSLLSRLPSRPVDIAVAAVFLIGGVVLLRGGESEAQERAEEEEVVARQAAATSFARIALTSASVVGLAELGDLTQLATASLATRTGAPVAVAIGAWTALASVAALAVSAGAAIERRVSFTVVRRVAGVVFVAIGLATLVGAFV